MTKTLLVFLTLITVFAKAQVSQDSALYVNLKKQDSILFQKGFNECDITYLEKHVASELKFYHDQSGIQNREQFLENTKKYICVDTRKPIRKLEAGSLVVFPLYNDGELYGAIQNGIHHFYIRETGKEDVWTSTAKFTHVWILEDTVWKISEVLSYDHQSER